MLALLAWVRDTASRADSTHAGLARGKANG
jgi:hypothetical protein